MATLSFIPPGLLAALASRPAAALLPRTPPSIRLHEPQRRPDDPRRINLFPGRALGEREFERHLMPQTMRTNLSIWGWFARRPATAHPRPAGRHNPCGTRRSAVTRGSAK